MAMEDSADARPQWSRGLRGNLPGTGENTRINAGHATIQCWSDLTGHLRFDNVKIKKCYEVARKNGATGGKLIGAGGGGFFMFYCNNHDKPKLIEAMQRMGLRWERFHFDFDGAKILVNA